MEEEARPTPKEIWEKYWEDYEKKLRKFERERLKKIIEWLSDIEKKPSTRAYKKFHNIIKTRLEFYKRKLKEVGEL